jgi:hypothetical protein
MGNEGVSPSILISALDCGQKLSSSYPRFMSRGKPPYLVHSTPDCFWCTSVLDWYFNVYSLPKFSCLSTVFVVMQIIVSHSLQFSGFMRGFHSHVVGLRFLKMGISPLEDTYVHRTIKTKDVWAGVHTVKNQCMTPVFKKYNVAQTSTTITSVNSIDITNVSKMLSTATKF